MPAWKTTYCKYWTQQGTCRFAEYCLYAHTDWEVRQSRSDPYRPGVTAAMAAAPTGYQDEQTEQWSQEAESSWEPAHTQKALENESDAAWGQGWQSGQLALPASSSEAAPVTPPGSPEPIESAAITASETEQIPSRSKVAVSAVNSEASSMLMTQRSKASAPVLPPSRKTSAPVLPPALPPGLVSRHSEPVLPPSSKPAAPALSQISKAVLAEPEQKPPEKPKLSSEAAKLDEVGGAWDLLL